MRAPSWKPKSHLVVILLLAALTLATTVIILAIRNGEATTFQSTLSGLAKTSQSKFSDYSVDHESQSSTIHLASVCGGFNSTKQFYVLLKSILFFRSNKIQLHLLVDNISQKLLKELFSQWKVQDLQVKYYNITEYEHQVSWISSPHYSHRFGLMKLVFPAILATENNIDKIILLDSDMLILGDVKALWEQFSTKYSNAIFGMVENQSDWYLGDSRLAFGHSIWPSLRRGYNSGLVLIDLKKLAQITWQQIWRQVAETQLTTSLYATLADQDIFNAVFKTYPELVLTLPCNFNLQLNEHTNTTLSCPGQHQVKLLHWNSPHKLFSDVSNSNYYVTWYRTFKNWSGKLLEYGLCCKHIHKNEQISKDNLCDEIKPKSTDRLRIFPYFYEYEIDFVDNDVTLVVHLSVDRLPVFEQLMSHWKGPVSTAIYLPEPEIDYFEEFVESSSTLSQRKNIGYHLVFRDEGINYPINRLRNIAMRLVQTPYIFLSDVDFLPSYSLHSYLRQTITEMKKHESGDPLEQKVLVISAFENSQYKFQFPASKYELTTQLDLGTVTTFRAQLWPQGQAPTDFAKWRTSTQAYEVEWKPDYEPFIVTSKSIPKFDERFGGFGWNKVEHTTLLAAKRYKFLILPDAFLIHKFHPASFDIMRHRSSTKYRSCIRSLKRSFLLELKSKYPSFFAQFSKNNLPTATEKTD